MPRVHKINLILYFCNSCVGTSYHARVMMTLQESESSKSRFCQHSVSGHSDLIRCTHHQPALFGCQFPYPFLTEVLLPLFSVCLFLITARSSSFQIPVICFTQTKQKERHPVSKDHDMWLYNCLQCPSIRKIPLKSG